MEGGLKLKAKGSYRSDYGVIFFDENDIFIRQTNGKYRSTIGFAITNIVIPIEDLEPVLSELPHTPPLHTPIYLAKDISC